MIAGATAVVLFGLIIVVAYGYERRVAQLDALDSEMLHTAAGAGEYLRNAVEAIDLRMNEGVRRYEQWQAGAQRDSSTGHVLLRDIVEHSRHLNGIGWMDAKGYLVASSVGPRRRSINVFDEDHFQAQISEDAGLYMSAPIISRQDNRRIVTLSRRLNGHAGAFAGVVTGFSDLKGLADGLDSVRTNRSIGLKLLRAGRAGEVLIDIPPALEGGKLLQRTVNIPGPLGLSVEITADTGVALEPWRKQLVLSIFLMGLLAFTAVTGAYALLRLLARWELANAAVLTSDLQLREAQRIANTGSWELDIAKGALTWSDEVFRIFERDSGSFKPTYDGFLAVVHPEDREKVDHAYKQSVSTRRPYEIRHRVLMSDGRVRWVHERGRSHFDFQGRPVRSVGTVQDVTREVEAENEMRQAREVFQLIVDGSPDLIYAKDLQHRFVMVNQAFARAHGRTPEQMLGRLDAEIPTAESGEQAGEAGAWNAPADEQKVYAGGEVRHRNDLLTFADGSVHTFDTYKGPLRDHEGNVIGLFSLARDITERQHFEAALQQLNASLEARVEERTRELELARQMAESASRAKTEFLARMSHELRTPLNGILGFSEVMMATLGDEVHREDARVIHDAGTHLLQLVNDLLDLSRIEAGQINLSLADTPLVPLVRELSSLHQAAATAKGVALRLDLAPGLPETIRTDVTRLRQILNNLLHNAVKFTEQGEVILAVMPSAGGISFAVTDHGIGIAPEDLPKIFERFRQLVRFESRAHGGAGLGLALAKEFTEMLGGRIEVQSQPGGGSTFTVWHPLGA